MVASDSTVIQHLRLTSFKTDFFFFNVQNPNIFITDNRKTHTALDISFLLSIKQNNYSPLKDSVEWINLRVLLSLKPGSSPCTKPL